MFASRTLDDCKQQQLLGVPPGRGIPTREVSAIERWRADPAELAPLAVAYHRFSEHW